MGISISQWRSAIGSFSSKFTGYPCKKLNTSPDPSFTRSGLLWQTVVLILTIITGLLISIPTSSISAAMFLSKQQCAISTSPLSAVSSVPWSIPPSAPCTSLSYWAPLPAFWLSNKERNRNVRALNGNRQSRGIKLAHWNAGSAYLANKMQEIEQVVSENHPHLLGISEANLKRGHDLDDVQLQGYDLVQFKTIDNDFLFTVS